MNTFVSGIVAAERHQAYIDQAAAHRRRHHRPARPGSERRSRLGAFRKPRTTVAT